MMESQEAREPSPSYAMGGDLEDESDADYRARMMHVDTFLRLNKSISALQELGEKNPEYVLGMRKILQQTPTGSDGGEATGDCAVATSNLTTTTTTDRDIKIKTHAHLIYHGDLLQLSKETVVLTLTRRDMTLFTRIIGCFKRMIMGQHTDEDVANMRRDHDLLITMWNDTPDTAALNIGTEINNMMRCMLETPLYFTNSCMALIACGQMLRNLYTETEGVTVDTYEDLMVFLRKHMRHNPVDPFECSCEVDGDSCSAECKTLMSMIMEVPAVVHNQTYLLQILAYLMYDRSGREEVFINNLKNTCSPGLLDKVPTRLAMLMGTLDADEIRRRYATIRKQTQHLNPLKEHTNVYSRSTLDKLVQLVHHPKVQGLIEVLPGANAVTVELRLPKCGVEKKNCLNREFDENTIMSKEFNNNGKNKCCGYLRQDPFDLLVSSVSLTQILIYLFTDPRSGTTKSRKHFFVRDIITTMAKQMLKIKMETLEEMFCYLDRTRVFKSFNEHPFMMRALQELFTSYIDYMRDAAEKYKDCGRKRRMRRYLKKNGVPDGAI